MPRFNSMYEKSARKKRSTEHTPSRHSRTKVSEDDEEDEGKKSKDLEEIKLRLGHITSIFRDGVWKNDVTDEKGKLVVQLRKENKNLQKQNNMILLKNEILLDMITTKCIKIQEMEEEIEQLKSLLQKSPLQRRKRE